MPELPEVETVRRGLLPVLQGARIKAVALARGDLREPFPDGFVARLEGRTVVALRRRAKYLLADLDSGETLIIHLGMSGSLRIVAGDSPAVPTAALYHDGAKIAAHDHVVFAIEGLGRLVYNDPRRFGLMTLTPTATLAENPLLAHLGVEPLSADLDGAFLEDRLESRRTSLKAALLDQTLIVGIGNIYACEALFWARLSPRRIAHTIGPQRAERLAAAIKEVLQQAIEAGGSTLRDYMKADGSLGYFQHTFAVYDRAGESCRLPACRAKIRRIVQSNRSSFFCPRCQR